MLKHQLIYFSYNLDRFVLQIIYDYCYVLNNKLLKQLIEVTLIQLPLNFAHLLIETIMQVVQVNHFRSKKKRTIGRRTISTREKKSD